MENNQKFALITGATSGIGYELAKLFAKDHYNLVIVARNQAELESKAQEFKQQGIEVIPIAKDLSKKDEAIALCEEVKSRSINIDVLVNDAGQGLYGLFKDTDLERELDIIHLNICATVILTKHFLKEMVSRNEGKILNLASVASKIPGPWQSVYHGTKAFVLSFSEAIRAELVDTNITVTALMPGATNTDFFNKAEMQDSKIVQDKDSLSDPADVAKDGYEALMAGDDKVISGFKNKAQVSMANLTPDSMVANMIKEQQKPVEQEQQQQQQNNE
ncbi:MAG: oxidoreductase [Mucilaginibacter sp.]|nr:oxidoreductase [Mucilaginibacter sp.]